MRIEAITVVVDFSDYLAETLPINMEKVDKLIVVTVPWDKRTIGICNRYGIECIETEVFYTDGDKFNKARGINMGLAHLKMNDFVIHLDSDIVLPPNFRKFLDTTELDKKNVYGIDRVNCVGRKAWEEYKKNPPLMFEWSWLVVPPPTMPLGGRIAHNEFNGYVPLGYFQMWHPNQSGVSRYPELHGSAERTDVLFSLKWTRPRRVLIPEMFCIHLETEKKPKGMGSDWSGRATPAFTLNEEPFPLSKRPGQEMSKVFSNTSNTYC